MNVTGVVVNALNVPVAQTCRIAVRRYDDCPSRPIVAIVPESYGDGEWMHGGYAITVAPDKARQLAADLNEIAAAIDGAPVDPQPTAADRENNRWGE